MKSLSICAELKKDCTRRLYKGKPFCMIIIARFLWMIGKKLSHPSTTTQGMCLNIHCCNVLSLPSQQVTVCVLPAAAASVLRTFSQLNVLNLVTAGYIDFGGREGGCMRCEKAQQKSNPSLGGTLVGRSQN